MSADLHLIVFDPTRVTPDEVREYLLPPAWEYNTSSSAEVEAYMTREDELRRKVYPAWDAPNRAALDPRIDDVWIGQVSWAKAGDVGTSAAYRRWVPRVVEAVEDLYVRHGHVVRLTPAIVTQITLAFNLPHTSAYEGVHNTGSARYPIWVRGRGIARAGAVKKFLWRHMGAYTFVDSL